MRNIEMRPVAVKLENNFYGRVKTLAKARKRSAHALMREAIFEYMEREEKRETLRQEMLKAWNDFQETGLHATADEVEKWLSSWGTENEISAPICHK